MKLYSLYDQKAEVFLTPVFFRAHGEAMRQVESESLKGDSMIGMHPEDFVLYYLGEFSIDTGEFQAESPPIVLTRVSDLLPSDQLGPVQ